MRSPARSDSASGNLRHKFNPGINTLQKRRTGRQIVCCRPVLSASAFFLPDLSFLHHFLQFAHVFDGRHPLDADFLCELFQHAE